MAEASMTTWRGTTRSVRVIRTSGQVLVAMSAVAALVLGPAATLPASATPSASSAAPGCYGPTASIALNPTTVDDENASTTVTGVCFAPNESVTITIASAPTTLGTTRSDSNGAFAASEAIPAELEVGQHTVTAMGATGDSALGILTVGEDENQAGTPGSGTPGGGTASPGVGASSAPSGPSGNIAFTGTNAILTAALGAAAIAVGGLLVLSSRKRRRHSWG